MQQAGEQAGSRDPVQAGRQQQQAVRPTEQAGRQAGRDQNLGRQLQHGRQQVQAAYMAAGRWQAWQAGGMAGSSERSQSQSRRGAGRQVCSVGRQVVR